MKRRKINVKTCEEIMDEALTKPNVRLTWSQKNELKNDLVFKLKKEWNKFLEGYVEN